MNKDIKKIDKKVIIAILVILIIVIIAVILSIILLNTDKEYERNSELIKFQDKFLKGTFYYDKKLETDGVVYYGLNTKSGKITLETENPKTIISYNVAPIDGTKERMIDEYIKEASEDITVINTTTSNVKISGKYPIDATKIKFLLPKYDKAKTMITYMVFDDENVYCFNYISQEEKEIEEFKEILETFVIE